MEAGGLRPASGAPRRTLDHPDGMGHDTGFSESHSASATLSRPAARTAGGGSEGGGRFSPLGIWVQTAGVQTEAHPLPGWEGGGVWVWANQRVEGASEHPREAAAWGPPEAGAVQPVPQAFQPGAGRPGPKAGSASGVQAPPPPRARALRGGVGCHYLARPGPQGSGSRGRGSWPPRSQGRGAGGQISRALPEPVRRGPGRAELPAGHPPPHSPAGPAHLAQLPLHKRRGLGAPGEGALGSHVGPGALPGPPPTSSGPPPEPPRPCPWRPADHHPDLALLLRPGPERPALCPHLALEQLEAPHSRAGPRRAGSGI